MQIFVKTLDGKNRICLDVGSTDTIADVKAKIQSKNGVSAQSQGLCYAGKTLENHLTLQHYKIIDDSLLHLVFRLRGGF